MRESVRLFRSEDRDGVTWALEPTSNVAKAYVATLPEGFHLGRSDLGRPAIFRSGSQRPVDIRDATMADRRPRIKLIDAQGHCLTDCREA